MIASKVRGRLRRVETLLVGEMGGGKHGRKECLSLARPADGEGRALFGRRQDGREEERRSCPRGHGNRRRLS